MYSKTIQFLYISFILYIRLMLITFIHLRYSKTIKFMYISIILFMFVGRSLKKLSSTKIIYIQFMLIPFILLMYCLLIVVM
jgi:hypothetical protein